jgi:hypothetical protein
VRLREPYEALHQRAVVRDERLHAQRECLDAKRAWARAPAVDHRRVRRARCARTRIGHRGGGTAAVGIGATATGRIEALERAHVHVADRHVWAGTAWGTRPQTG